MLEAAAAPPAVPAACYCAFVDPRFLAAWVALNSTGTARLTIDRDYFLTSVLLHEAGHVQPGTAAAAFKDREMIQLKVDASKEKADERRAAGLPRRRANTKPANAASIAENFVGRELIRLRWNIQAYRTLDEFGSFAAGKPTVYFDDGYTDLNMALRILRSNDPIQASPETRQILDAFEEARLRRANPQPLYRPR
ncbi:hypothetical protein [Variovorax sp. J31P207]|uniref:hypothetical protein n=1 Tax=Variovorax sp. J31P207 TaxID=3053510 RepID=UPI002576227C|nr:hypothetical protein [Variovorax sp. J31P207]MDM0071483.1 hypothetical protein [Variovorax sp. J31P207]